jgi:tetratricopeptide (TPR) repeat protein
VVLWAVLVGLALWGVRRRAIWSFALLWYLVGHSLESSFVSLELMFEHRNYLPSFGILFAVAYYLLWGLRHLASTRRLAYPLVGVIALVLAFTTYTRAGIWGDKYTVIEFSLRNHPNSSRTHGEYAITNAQRAADLELAYKHWARAAELNPSSALELIEMARVLAVQILAFQHQAEQGAAVPEEFPPPTDFRDPMRPDLAYLKALDSVVSTEIDRRLQSRPVQMGNVAALRSLEHCIHTNLEPCVVMLPRAIAWFELASENPRSLDSARAVLRLGLAKLYAAAGQLEKAVDSAKAAVRTDPGQVHYLFELASLYLALGDLDAAQETISAAENKLGVSGFRHGVVRDLKHNLERAREIKKAAAAASG